MGAGSAASPFRGAQKQHARFPSKFVSWCLTMSRVTIYQVDSFTDTAFQGNPAAVCLLSRSVLPLDDTTRQRIAAEMNLSETAFLECLDGSDDFSSCSHFKLRWFTPQIEVPLCGHATLASAAALLQAGGSRETKMLRFDTLSGELRVTAEEGELPAAADAGGAGGANLPLLCMDFPLMEGGDAPGGLGAGSELVQAVVGNLRVESVAYAPPLRYLLIVLKRSSCSTREALQSLRPDMQRMEAAHSGGQLVGVIVTAQGDGSTPHDFYSRFFAPWAGIKEDPVTGSAHCVLGPYWAQRLGKSRLLARQCSPRGGELRVTVDERSGRVEVAGQAVIVLEGQLLLPGSQA